MKVTKTTITYKDRKIDLAEIEQVNDLAEVVKRTTK